MHVVRDGRGPALVLLHGIGHSSAAWTPVVRHLREAFTTYALDSPGFGASPPLAAGHDASPRGYADVVAAWIAAEGLGRPHVAGSSMGGGIALELARMGVVTSATAVAPVGFWSDAERRFASVSLLAARRIPRLLRPAMLAMQGSTAGRASVGQYFGRPGAVSPGYAREALRGLWACAGFERALDGFRDYDFGRGHELRGTRVTIAWGTRDALLLAGPQRRRAQQRLPWARHVALPGLGHLPMGEDPGRVAEVVRIGTWT